MHLGVIYVYVYVGTPLFPMPSASSHLIIALSQTTLHQSGHYCVGLFCRR